MRALAPEVGLLGTLLSFPQPVYGQLVASRLASGEGLIQAMPPSSADCMSVLAAFRIYVASRSCFSYL
jgi:hypothetical protein